MTHNEVYKLFSDCVPAFAEWVELWFTNGKNSIRVRLYNKHEFVFTGTSNSDWRFETKESFVRNLINSVKEKKKNAVK